jgi:hypothetical protein
MKFFRKLAIIVLALAAPTVALAQAPSSFQDMANTVAKIFNAGAILLITATIVVYFYGIVGNIYNMRNGKADNSDMRKNILWGIIIIFFMVSIWGIVQILQYSLFGGPSPSASNGVIIYNNNQ